MKGRFLHLIVLDILLISHFSACLTAKASDPKGSSKYLDAVREFADNVLKYGRDTYGSKHTPLFVDGLMVRDPNNPDYGKDGVYKPVEWISPEGEKWVLSNLASQQNLFRTLDGLTAITGDPKYKQVAMDAIEYAFENLRSPNGLLYWGKSTAYDARGDKVCGNKYHEFKAIYPYYELMWSVSPQGTEQFIESLWASHILDWSNLEMNRIGPLDVPSVPMGWDHEYKGGPVPFESSRGASFSSAGSDLYYAAALLFKLSGQEKSLIWAKRLGHRYVEVRNPATGIGYGEFTFRTYLSEYPLDVDFKGHSVYHAVSGNLFVLLDWSDTSFSRCRMHNCTFSPGTVGNANISEFICQLLVGDMLGTAGKEFQQWALEELSAWGNIAYRKEENSWIPMLSDGTSVEGYILKGDTNEGPMGKAFKAWKANPTDFWTYALAFRVTGDGLMWQMARNIGHGNGFGNIGARSQEEPQLNTGTDCSNPHALLGFLNLYESTRKRQFLDMAKRIGDNILVERFHKGFFVPSEKHIYSKMEAIESLVLLHLYSALRPECPKPPLVWPGRPYFWGAYRGKDVAYDNTIIYTLTESPEPPISLNEAAATGNLDLAKSLIVNGADINNREDTTFKTPLVRAVLSGHKQMVELLLANGADINVGKASPLYYAVLYGHKEIAEILITHGADWNTKLLDVAVANNHKDIAELLIAKGADVTLHAAVFVGDLAKVKSLIEEKADINAKDAVEKTALHYAAERGYKEVAELLITKGADVNAKNTAGDTPLHLATRAGHKDVVELLITKGADVNAKNKQGQTPLDITVTIRNTKIAFISVVAASLVAGIVLAILLVFRLRRVTGQPKRFFRYFALFIGMYFVEYLAALAGIVFGFSFGFVWTLALVSGLTSVWGVIFGIWLRGRSALRDILKVSFCVCLYASLPMVCFIGILFPVLTIIQGQSIVSAEVLRGNPLEALPSPLNTVLGVSVALAVGTVLVKSVILTGIVTLFVRSKATVSRTVE